MSILDYIKNKETAPQLGQTQAIQRLATAKTGKAVEGPRLSSQQEKLAQAQAIPALEEQQEREEMAFRGLEEQSFEIKQQAEQNAARMTQQALSVSQQMQQEAANLINNFQKDTTQLELAKNKARIEQLGFNLRLSDQQYIDKLKAAGRKARLDNEIRFQEALTRTIFEDEMELFNNDLQFRSLLNANEREFEKELANIDIETALKLAATDAETQSSRMMWSGIAQMGAAGIEAWAGMDDAPEPTNEDSPWDTGFSVEYGSENPSYQYTPVRRKS